MTWNYQLHDKVSIGGVATLLPLTDQPVNSDVKQMVWNMLYGPCNVYYATQITYALKNRYLFRFYLFKKFEISMQAPTRRASVFTLLKSVTGHKLLHVTLFSRFYYERRNGKVKQWQADVSKFHFLETQTTALIPFSAERQYFTKQLVTKNL